MEILLDTPFEIVAEAIVEGLVHISKAQGLSVTSEEKSEYHWVTVKEVGLDLTPPPDSKLGDFAFGCFKISKSLGLKPNEVAQFLESFLAKKVGFQVRATGPYLNIRLNPELYYQVWAQGLLDEDIPLGEQKSLSYFKKPLIVGGPKTMVEFSQPNTHKELHVGHLRNASLGDALVRIKRFVGFEVVSSTYPGDLGTHVAKCLWYLRYHNQESAPLHHQGEWLGRLYSRAYLKLEEEKGTDLEEVNRQQLTLILKQLEEQKGEFFDLWVQTRQWSVDLMKRLYQWLHIDFDVWYWESEVDQESRHYIQSLFDRGLLVKSQGAVGMDLSEDGLGFCLLLKTDGTGLYATKDVELARRKFQDFKIQRSIYVVDVRQALHFSQIFKVLEKIGFPQAKDCFHLQYQFVELPDGAMSSRKGNIVSVTTLIEEMMSMIQKNYLAKYCDEWTKEEIDQTAHQIALGAIKYGMLRIDTAKKIVFDKDEWLRIDGDSGPSIQYSLARIKSLIKKMSSSLEEVESSWSLLSHEAEKVLIRQGIYFKTVTRQAALQDKPHLLTNYLYDLAKAFNSFYHECSIGHAESLCLKKSRLELCQVIGAILEKGLSLLGIPSPSRM
jgi:arginyl-tRNA synthetase